MARSRSINYITTDLKYDRSNRAPAFGAFPSARRLANATWTGLKMEIETEGTTSKFQRQLVSRETLGNFCVSSRSKRSLSLIRTKTLFRKLSIYLRTSASSTPFTLFFFSFPFARLLFFFFVFTSSLSHSLPLFLTLFFSIQSHRAHSDGGCFFFFFLFLSSKYRVTSCPRFLRVSVLQDKTIRVSSCHLSTFVQLRKPKNGNSQIRVVQRKVR